MGDEHFTARLLAGDMAAFSQVVDKYQSRVYSVALGILGRREDALDAAQETFLRAYTGLARWQGRGLSSWLCRIAANVSLDILRQRRRQLPSDCAGEQPDPRGSPEDYMLQQEFNSEVAKAVAELAPQYRQLIIMRHAGELSYADMAEILQLSLSQVKNRLMRARRMLRARLEKEVRG